MFVRITTKILSVVGLAALTIMPVQETAYARSIGGGSTGNTSVSNTYQKVWNDPVYSKISGGNGSSLIPGGYQYDPSKGITGGTSGGSRGITGGGTSNGDHGINGGGANTSYGSSLIPGGYQYDPNSGTSSGSRGITGGGTSTGDHGISGGGSNTGYGSSLIPGGYQYDPSKGITGGTSSGSRGITGGGSSTGGREITGGGTSSGGREITGGGSSSGGREITGGGSSSGGREITGGGSSNGSREITGGGSSSGGREITGGGTVSCGYGSSLIPGGYQYCPGNNNNNDNDNDDNDDNNNNNDDDDNNVNPVEETTYYACEDDEDDVALYIKVMQDGDDYTIRLYEQDEKGAYFISDEMTGEEVAEFIADKQEDYDCHRISKSEFNDRFDNNDDDDADNSTCNNRSYPEDIDGHWAEIYVRRLYDLCVTEGYNDGSFRPNQYVTRAELVKMGLYANGLEPNEGCYDNDCGSPYNDLDEWQGPWIRTAYDHDIVEGYANEKFYPNRYITREEAVKVVLATYGYTPLNVNKSFFNDVSGWSTGWIERAHEIGMVQGIGNGNFDPQRPITRAEAAKIIVKMIEHWDTEIK